jgi:hypothetical protein
MVVKVNICNNGRMTVGCIGVRHTLRIAVQNYSVRWRLLVIEFMLLYQIVDAYLFRSEATTSKLRSEF